MIRAVTGFARRRPVVVILLWLAVTVGGFTVGNGVFARMTTTVGAVPGSGSARADQAMADAGLSPPVITAVVTGDPAAIRAAIANLRAVDGVTGVTETVNDRAVLVNVELAHRGDRLADRVRDGLTGIDGATAVVAGGPLTDREFNEQAAADIRRAEIVSAPLLLILLLVVFGSLIAAGLPLLIAVSGVAGTFLALLVMSLVTDVSVYSIQVTTMLAIGLGVDYALLMVSRFREELASARDPGEALAVAAERSGRTVVFSGLTVAVALAALLAFADPFLRSIGLAGAAVVLIDMVAAITLLPALLQLLRHRIPAGRVRTGRLFGRVAGGVQRAALPVLLLVVGGLVVAALPLAGLRLGHGDPRSLPAPSDTRQLANALSRHFPEMSGPAPLVVVTPDGPAQAALRQRIAAVPGVVAVEPGRSGGGVTILRVVPERAADDRLVRAVRGTGALVTGEAARLSDYRAQLRARLPLAGGIALAATFVLLLAFTRSVLIPLKALATNVLSLAAALGVVVWVFQDGHLTEPLGAIDLTVPVVVAAIAFGLATDYEVFVLSRIRERRLAGADPAAAVRDGIQRSGGIVTAAALLLAVTFAGFMTGGFAPVREVGLGLVTAVAVDALIVRMLLVPASMTLLGRAAWWAPRFGQAPVRSSSTSSRCITTTR